jgi:hypothetical protein
MAEVEVVAAVVVAEEEVVVAAAAAAVPARPRPAERTASSR